MSNSIASYAEFAQRAAGRLEAVYSSIRAALADGATLVRTRIAGLGHYLPERVLTNAELEKMVDTSDQWIRDRTGIEERHIAAPHETSSSLGLAAARMALDHAGVRGEDIDLVIAGTTTPDGLFPSVASLVQDGIGATNAGAFDVNSACVGFLAALSTGFQFVATGASRRVLVIGTEVLSRIVDWHDRSTCVLFADGAGALILEAAEFGGPLGIALHSDGSKKSVLFADGPCGPRDASGAAPAPETFTIHMDGPATFKFAVQAMASSMREALDRARLTVDDIDLLVPHQANLRIIQGTAKALGVPVEKAFVTVHKYGNTSSASIAVALSEAMHTGRLTEGMKVALCAFGGGASWGSLLLEYSRSGIAPVTASAPLVEAHAGRD